MLLVSEVRLNKTMTSKRATCRLACFTSCVGRWESEKRTCHAEPVEQKAQTPGRRCKTPRGTCPNPSVVSLLSLLGGSVGRVPRGTGARIRVFLFRQFSIFDRHFPNQTARSIFKSDPSIGTQLQRKKKKNQYPR